MANENRLIDANAVENKIRQIIDEVQKMRYDRAKYKYAVNYIDEIYKLDNWLGCYAEVLDVVEEAPTVEAVEVVHGRWIPLEYDGYADGNPVWDLWECSECQEEHSGDEDTLTPYCPNCGAKMDGDGNGNL